MTLMLGIWINDDPLSNKAEIARAELLINEFAPYRVFNSILVSNEAIFVIKVDPLVVAESIRAVQAIVANSGDPSIPVGFAEIYSTLTNTSLKGTDMQRISKSVDVVAKTADFIGLNSHPYWGGVDPTTVNAGKHVADGWQHVADKWNKPTIITETGYPTKGEAHTTAEGSATPSLEGLTHFLRQMEAESRMRDIPVCTLISALAFHVFFAFS
jgi:exo-beta-1,3-glucanase (GH17 family)